MPVYEYTCETCGPFELWQPARDASAARSCPECDAPARRHFTPPGVFRTPAPLRAARDRELRSAHVPELVSAPSGRPLPGHLGHGHGHSH